MPQPKFKKIYLLFIALILLTRVVYSFIGTHTLTKYKDVADKHAGWRYDSENKFLNIWTVWDSGLFYQIASEGYPKITYSIPTTTITIPPSNWVRVSLGSGGVGETNYYLPDSTTSKISNSLFLLGSPSLETKVRLYNIYPNIPYCFYSGPIDYDRDVAIAASALELPNGCGEVPCDTAFVTYFDAQTERVVYQERFDGGNPTESNRVLGSIRPSGFEDLPYQGFGCSTTSESTIQLGPSLDYENVITPYNHFPAFPYAAKALSYLFGDIVLSGVFVSIIAFIMSAIFLYELILVDYSQRIALYATLSYIVFPFGFIATGFFSEGLFNMLLFGALLSLRKNNIISASVFAAFATLTRVLGVLLVVIIFIHLLRNRILKLGLWGEKRDSLLHTFKKLIPLALVPSALLGHLLYLYSLTNDIFVMRNSQKAFGRFNGSFLGNIKYNISFFPEQFYFEIFWYIIVILLSFAGLYLLKRQKSSKMAPIEYFIYFGYSMVIPVLDGIFTSIPRYSITIFPVYMGLSYILTKFKRPVPYVLLGVLFALSCVMMALWVLGTRFIV